MFIKEFLLTYSTFYMIVLNHQQKEIKPLLNSEYLLDLLLLRYEGPKPNESPFLLEQHKIHADKIRKKYFYFSNKFFFLQINSWLALLKCLIFG